MSSFLKLFLLFISFVFSSCTQDHSEKIESKAKNTNKKRINYPNSLFYNVKNEDLSKAKNIIYYKNIIYTLEDANKSQKELVFSEKLFNNTLNDYNYKGPIEFEIFGSLYSKILKKNYYWITLYKKPNKIFKKFEINADSCFLSLDTVNVLKTNKWEKYSIYKHSPYETDSNHLFRTKEYVNTLCKNNGLKVIKIDTLRNISYDEYGKDKWHITNSVIENSILRSKGINFAGFSNYTLLDKEFLKGIHNYHYYDTIKEKWIKIMPFEAHRFSFIDENVIIYDYGCCGALPVVSVINYISNDTILKSLLRNFIKFYDSSSNNNVVGYFGISQSDSKTQMFISNKNRILKMVDLSKYDYDAIYLTINDVNKIKLGKSEDSYKEETINISNNNLKFNLIKKDKVVFLTEIRFD